MKKFPPSSFKFQTQSLSRLRYVVQNPYRHALIFQFSLSSENWVYIHEHNLKKHNGNLMLKTINIVRNYFHLMYPGGWFWWDHLHLIKDFTKAHPNFWFSGLYSSQDIMINTSLPTIRCLLPRGLQWTQCSFPKVE